uniref:ATP synthase complex subunit 8 n=1 Tax=Coquillettidia linealis TaxID=1806174 RepID=A0A7T0GEH8_9DIPT|nr:ATP synthase F0 subunit 8 [Coquillettidia linealis]QPJ78438.1 ATP synthase F0 subunit 8 [Coquillettidia linealis]
MPQMAPISWLLLFFIFSFTLVIFNIKNYYCFYYSPLQLTQNININQHKLNWKW